MVIFECQIHEEARKFAYQTRIKIGVAYGGASFGQQVCCLCSLFPFLRLHLFLLIQLFMSGMFFVLLGCRFPTSCIINYGLISCMTVLSIRAAAVSS